MLINLKLQIKKIENTLYSKNLIYETPLQNYIHYFSTMNLYEAVLLVSRLSFGTGLTSIIILHLTPGKALNPDIVTDFCSEGFIEVIL